MKPGKTVGVYDRPAPKKWPKVAAIIVAVIVVIIGALILMDQARGAPVLHYGTYSYTASHELARPGLRAA